jgi:hypothetical protein
MYVMRFEMRKNIASSSDAQLSNKNHNTMARVQIIAHHAQVMSDTHESGPDILYPTLKRMMQMEAAVS